MLPVFYLPPPALPILVERLQHSGLRVEADFSQTSLVIADASGGLVCLCYREGQQEPDGLVTLMYNGFYFVGRKNSRLARRVVEVITECGGGPPTQAFLDRALRKREAAMRLLP